MVIFGRTLVFASFLIFGCSKFQVAGAGLTQQSSIVSNYSVSQVKMSQNQMCLEVPAGASTPSLLLDQTSCLSSSSAQSFLFEVQTDGTSKIHPNSNLSLCLDLSDDGHLVQNFCFPTASQSWQQTLGSDGSVTGLVNSGNSLCLNIEGGSNTSGANFVTSACSSSSSAQALSLAATAVSAPTIPDLSTRTLPTTPVAGASIGIWQAGNFQGLPYRIMFPPGYDPIHHKYELILFLHGSGQSGTDNLQQTLVGINVLSSNLTFRAQFPAIIVAPQCPTNPTCWGYGLDTNASAEGLLAYHLAQSLSLTLSVDTDRIQLTGLSMGGLGTYDIMIRYPGTFAGYGPLAGAGDPSKSAQLLQTPIYAVHGSADPTVPVSYDEQMYANIHGAGGIMIYNEIAGAGHDVWDSTYADVNFWNWLYSQHK